MTSSIRAGVVPCFVACLFSCSQRSPSGEGAATIQSGAITTQLVAASGATATSATDAKVNPESAIGTAVQGDNTASAGRGLRGGCQPWSELSACRHDGFVYASAKGASDSRLGEATAIQRARGAIGVDLEKSEIPAVALCADGVHALARAPVSQGGPSLPACATSLVAPAPPTGCPDWTSKRSYLDGETLYVVAVVDPALPVALAQTVAENAARAEAAAFFHWSGQHGVAKVSASLRAQLNQEHIACGGKTYVRLSYASR